MSCVHSNSRTRLRTRSRGWAIPFLLSVYLIALTIVSPTGSLAASDVKEDEAVVFYPSLGVAAGSEGWRVRIHGLIYEPGRHRHEAFLFGRLLGLEEDEMTADERRTFLDRINPFLVDHESGKRLRLALPGRQVRLGTSGADGQFVQEVILKPEDVVDSSGATWKGGSKAVQLPVVTAKGGTRMVSLPLELMEERGWSVISDIDDTIRISHVRDRHAMIWGTFCRPLRPVPGLADVYRSWSSEGAQFHYVSASPWQLYPALATFVASNGYPNGTFSLKPFRPKDRTFWNILQPPMRYKTPILEELLRQFPHRRFVLVGDSGESDPEIYGELARRHRHQVEHIFIRDVTGEDADAARYRESFRDLPVAGWTIFKDAAELRVWSISALDGRAR